MPQRLKSPSTTSESNDLRNAGLKVTLPRLKILDILADGSARHIAGLLPWLDSAPSTA